MALILSGSRCALCNQVYSETDELVATSAFIPDRGDPLWRFSDASMHKRCFLTWDQRMAFVRRFNEAMKPYVFWNGTRHHMEEDGTIKSIPA
jgi:hypothetical protein